MSKEVDRLHKTRLRYCGNRESKQMKYNLWYPSFVSAYLIRLLGKTPVQASLQRGAEKQQDKKIPYVLDKPHMLCFKSQSWRVSRWRGSLLQSARLREKTGVMRRDRSHLYAILLRLEFFVHVHGALGKIRLKPSMFHDSFHVDALGWILVQYLVQQVAQIGRDGGMIRDR